MRRGRGVGAAVVIEGPAGIGKTSLLARARKGAAESGMSVLHGRGTQLERQYAMGLVRQSLEPTVRGHPYHEELFAGAARLARAVVLDIPDDLDAAPVGVLHGPSNCSATRSSGSRAHPRASSTRARSSPWVGC